MAAAPPDPAPGTTHVTALRGEAAGVPFVALPPEGAAADAPLVVAWHLLDPPRSESAMAAALPLRGLPAWRVYLGLPLSGSRLPEGRLEALYRLGYEDAVARLFRPIVRRALRELPAALAELRERLEVGDAELVLMGGSVGALVAQSVVADTDTPVRAAALVSPAVRLASVIATNERRFEVTYRWSDRTRATADQLDFVARADELAARRVPMLLVVGEHDDEQGFRAPAAGLRRALADRGGDVELAVVPGMEHALADEPGLAAAPQTPQAASVDALVVAWLERHLGPA